MPDNFLTPSTALVFLVPLLLVGLTGNHYITFLKQKYFGQYIREDGPQSHQSKAGTPTAGGILILGAVLIGHLLAGLLKGSAGLSITAWLVLIATLLLGGLGFWDDYLKIAKKHNKGLSGYSKLAIQGLVGLAIGLYAMQGNPTGEVSLFQLATLQLGWLYPVFAMLVITGTSNAVNLTDGLDGLAASTAACSFLSIAFIFSLITPFPDLAWSALILLGATLGFLWFNKHPARIFMGDSGSLALGGAIGALAVLGHLEFWLLLLGGIFVLEALSVILQVISFKTTGKRIFKMSPIHHHFELSGWSEPMVVQRFIAFQFLLCLAAIFMYNNLL
jgi:phospho-N-acetylmuramoyl-pentapeptide-transferase